MTDPLERVAEVLRDNTPHSDDCNSERWMLAAGEGGAPHEKPCIKPCYRGITVNLADSLLAVAKAAEAEHKYVETVDGEGDDWTGCLCGEAACPILAALASLRSTAKELM